MCELIIIVAISAVCTCQSTVKFLLTLSNLASNRFYRFPLTKSFAWTFENSDKKLLVARFRLIVAFLRFPCHLISIYLQIKNPHNPTYFTNRALCYIKMKKFEAACQDCRRALDMDQNLIKGHFFLGLSLHELHMFDEAIKHLQRGEMRC